MLQFPSAESRGKILLILALIGLTGWLVALDAPVSDASSTPAISLAANPIEPGVFLGDEHSCVLTNDGLVKCWGRNEFGQQGIGTTETIENEALARIHR